MYNSNCTVWVLLCHHRIAAHIHCSLSPTRTHQQSPSFPLLKPWVDPLYSAEPICTLFVIYSYWSAFLLFVFDMQYSKMTRQNKPGPLMPRRPPPTPLLLVRGPLPPRGESKFTMPSVPRPIFHPSTATAVVRRRVSCDPIEAGVMGGVKSGDLAAPSRTVSR